MTVFGDKAPVARKEYECNACLHLVEYLDSLDGFTFGEKRVIAMAKRDGWKIKKGQRYRYYNYRDGGDIHFGLRERLDVAALCAKYDLYGE